VFNPVVKMPSTSLIRALNQQAASRYLALSSLHQQVRKLSLEHADVTSSTDIDAGMPLMISALIKRLSEEAAGPVLPRDIISRISRISPTESFREPKAV
jgi:hypothetical protein